MAKKEKNKDLLENPEALADTVKGVEHWIEDNPKIVFSVLGVLLLLVGGFFGYRYYVGSQEKMAQKEMFQAVHYFEADSLDLALKGDGNNLGFEQIIDDYGLTDAANLANFYAGAISLKQGKFQLAIFYFEDFSSDDILIQPRAYSLMGDAYMELKDYASAAKYYNKASNYKPNKFFTPAYLMKEALAYERLNENKKAVAVYEKIISEFWDSGEYQNARKFKAKLEANS
ncbi:MAG TPA: tetratricopeptide repeat protein [Cyclobacteriaceae bacterium]|nr:tetratricopeptide repeat protein [Cyclobacteriaceae bacterium]MCB9237284.1 tetratricopeptide repeat protein [Flammeovirgaceae bacterium]MCB0500219.1 tetratricopeptide repeat protein [Cyclobacteriaceae bacterium]MCO5270994.1 tetratricopeptide repeat protein [Cyclobacteriaceae bacterium]MCW5903371.1 tetratricopeptide repeat protein [Cyclobacteriaceae bacterium]